MTRILFAAALLAAATSTATAEPVTLQPLGGPGNFTVVFGKTHTSAGYFEDEYFIPFAGPALANGQLIAIYQPSQAAMNRIRFKDVELDEVDLDLSTVDMDVPGIPPTVMEFAQIVNPIPTDGGFLLTVAGCAGANCGRGGNDGNNGINRRSSQAEIVTASYSGTINLRVAPTQNVPEPASLALVVAAIGAAGLARRRSVRTATAPAPAASRGRRS